MSRIAVVGGHGQVARHLLVALRRSEHDPVALVRREEYRAELESPRRRGPAARHRAATTPPRSRAAFAGCDAVVFAAGGGPDGNMRAQAHRRPRGLAEVHRGRAAGRDRPVRAGLRHRRRRPAAGGHRRRSGAAYVEAKRDADAALRASDLAWTIIRPGPAHRRPGDRAGRARPGRRPAATSPGPTSPRCWPRCSTSRRRSARSGTW